jgi:membrane protein
LAAIENIFPDLVGRKPGQVPISSLEDAAGAIDVVSLVGLIYAGLGWITAMRDALESIFERPPGEQPNFVVGKLRDLVSLVSIGALLLVSVAVAGLVSGLTGLVLQWLGLDSELDWFVELLARVLGFVANVLLFFVIFRLVARPRAPTRSQWSGAVLGAVAFEALKALSFVLLASTREQPAFQAFGIALILLVWINYFSRVVLYAAAWVHTSAAARGQRERAVLEADRAGPD